MTVGGPTGAFIRDHVINLGDDGHKVRVVTSPGGITVKRLLNHLTPKRGEHFFGIINCTEINGIVFTVELDEVSAG